MGLYVSIRPEGRQVQHRFAPDKGTLAALSQSVPKDGRFSTKAGQGPQPQGDQSQSVPKDGRFSTISVPGDHGVCSLSQSVPKDGRFSTRFKERDNEH